MHPLIIFGLCNIFFKEPFCKMILFLYKERILKKKFEKALLNTMKDGNFEEIEFIITPRALVNCESSCLLMGMKVCIKLCVI